MFCKSSARVAFVLLWRLMRFFQSERAKKERFSEKSKKRDSLLAFLGRSDFEMVSARLPLFAT